MIERIELRIVIQIRWPLAPHSIAETLTGLNILSMSPILSTESLYIGMCHLHDLRVVLYRPSTLNRMYANRQPFQSGLTIQTLSRMTSFVCPPLTLTYFRYGTTTYYARFSMSKTRTGWPHRSFCLIRYFLHPRMYFPSVAILFQSSEHTARRRADP